MPASSQDAAFRHYTVSQGLASATVYSCIQDRQGYMWFATESGLNRFNGRIFDQFSVNDGLADSEIFRVYEDRKGRIWFLSFNGRLSYYYNGTFYNERNAPFLKDAFCGQSLMEIREDSKERIWITTYSNYLIKIEGDNARIFTFPFRASQSGGIYVLLTDSGNAEFGFKSEIYRYDEFSGEMRFSRKTEWTFLSQRPAHSETADRFELLQEGILMNPGPRERLVIRRPGTVDVNHFTCVYMDSDNMLWAGTIESGVDVYRLKKDSATLINKHLADQQISDMTQDKEGNMWFCTRDDGVYMMPSSGRNARVYAPGKTLPTGNIYALMMDRAGRIWAGSDRGYVTCIDKRDGAVTQYHLAKDNKNNYRVMDIKEDLEGTIWITTSFSTHKIDRSGKVSLVLATNREFEGPRAGKSLTVDGDGTVYLAFYAGVARYNRKKGGFELLPNQEYPVRTFHIHSSNRGILIANINGLNEYRNDSLIGLYKNDPRLTYRIAGITAVGDSTLVIATHGSGILVYRNDSIIQALNNESGLPSDDCRSLFAYGNELWVVTDAGLSRYYYLNHKLIPTDFIFPSNFITPNDIRCVYRDDRFLYLGTSVGLFEIDLLFKTRPLPPLKVLLTEFEVNNSQVQPGPSITLKYFQNNIGIRYEAISFSNPNKLEYTYRIRGPEDPWKSSKGNRVQFTLLPPGSYTFEVRARVAAMDWGPVTRLKFTIKKPLWQETWFYTVLFLVAAVSVSSPFYFYYRKKIRERWRQLDKQLAVNRERQRISQDLHDDLGSSLTTIRMNTDIIGIKKRQSDDFSRELNEIKKYAAEATERMSDIIWAVSASNDNLASLVSYIHEFVSDYEERTGIPCVMNFPPEIPDVPIRPEARKNLFLSVKEAFHNIQKHAQATEITFSLILNDPVLNILIKDNGIGIDSDRIRESSVGLESMKSRIAAINGNLVILSNPGSGTEVILRFNFRNEGTLPPADV